MPGYAGWKTLYKNEYLQLREEGYPVGDAPEPDTDDRTEAQWEAAYRELWKVRDRGMRTDYPYEEPDALEEILEGAGEMPHLKPLTFNRYRERISGAWFGRCAGVVLGKPLEMELNRRRIREYLESVDAYPLDDWVPARSEPLGMELRQDCVPSTRGNVAYVQPDDDIHYTILALLLAETKGYGFSTYDVGINWLDNVPYHWFWCASRQVYYHLVTMTEGRPKQEQVDEMAIKLNPWRECIDGQLRGDFWGYINPGDPIAAARLCHNDCALSLVKNGKYGGMFVAGCIAAALTVEPTIERIIAGGLAVIPKRSRLAETVRTVVGWYEEEADWISVCDRIYERWGHLPFAGTMNNLAIVVLALVHGDLDFTRTITTAVMAGIDTDCNSATAGSIVGAAVGYDGLDRRWIDPLNDTVKTAVAGFGEGSISELAERTVRLYRRDTGDGR